jgi:predicted secreted protein
MARATVNETFIVQFSSGLYDRGYAWSVNTSAGIQYLNNTTVFSSGACTGCPFTYDYFFRAVQGGTQTITLQAKHAFPPYDVAATINLQVVVPGGTTTMTAPG